MKKIFLLFVNCLLFIFLSFTSYSTAASNSLELFEKIKIDQTFLPEGFVFGKIPNFAKEVIKNNPWNMNRSAINKLTDHIYPNADPSAVQEIYMSIFARQNQPYGDDLVCYIILYKDATSTKREKLKLEEFAKINSDRVMTLTKDNIAIMMHVDDANDIPLLHNIYKKIKDTMEN